MDRVINAEVEVVRNGAVVTTLQYENYPQINADSGADIKTSFSGTFLYNDKVKWLTDEFRPVVIIGSEKFNLGVFIASSVKDQYNEYGAHYVQIECYDRCFLLQSLRTETRLHFSAGTLYTDAVGSLLVSAGLPLYTIEKSTDVLATDREDWEIGTSYLEIINQLLDEISYSSIWFNENGYAVIGPEKDITSENIRYIYGEKSESFTMVSMEREVDVFNKPNVFIVKCENPDVGVPLIATSVNDNPLSQLSTVQRGKRIAMVYSVDNIASQSALQKYARRMAYNSMMQSETMRIETLIEPQHGIGDIVAMYSKDYLGPYREIGWKISLGVGGTMEHTLRKMVVI